MNAKYFEKTGEIVLYGKGNEFNLLSKTLRIDESRLDFEHQESELSTNTKNLEYVQIKHLPSDYLVKISVKNRHLLLEGSPQKLLILSENLEVGDEEIKNYHIHIEYYEDHFFLSPESNALVVQYT